MPKVILVTIEEGTDGAWIDIQGDGISKDLLRKLARMLRSPRADKSDIGVDVRNNAISVRIK